MNRLSVIPLLVILTAAVPDASAAPPPPTVEACFAKAREKAAAAFEKGATVEEARRVLEIDAASCQDPNLPGATATFIGTIHADLAVFARDFLLGHMSAVDYKNARRDRSRKLRDLRDEVRLHAWLQAGDADRDLIADHHDRCPDTPYAAPTDDVGCPTRPDPRPPAGDEERFHRALRGMRLLENDACLDVAEPTIPKPFLFGRDNSEEPPEPGSPKFVLSQVNGLPDGCHVFYELGLHFVEPADANAPASRSVTVLFGEGEDLESDPGVVMFALPAGEPLTPGRTAAFEAFAIYQRINWRARAVIGGPKTSDWSASVLQAPLSSGLP